MGSKVSLWHRRVVWGAGLSFTFLSCLNFLQRVSCTTVINKNDNIIEYIIFFKKKREVLRLRRHFWSLHLMLQKQMPAALWGLGWAEWGRRLSR